MRSFLFEDKAQGARLFRIERGWAKTNSIARLGGIATCIVTAWCLAAAPALAANKTWNAGVNNTWDTATTANWTGSTWANGDEAIFGAAGVGNVNVVVGGVTATMFTFNTAGYTIGGGPITLDTGNLAQFNVNQSATINSNLNKTGGGYWNGIVASGATLTLNGSLNASAASEMYYQGAGSVVINGSIGSNFTNFRLNSGTTNVTLAASNSFSGYVLLEGAGSKTLTLQGANSFTGLVQLTGAAHTLNFSDVNQLGAGTATNWIAIQNGSTLRYTGSTAGGTTNRDIYWNSGAATFDITSATGNLTLNSTGGTRNGPLTKAGAGTLTLSAVNAAAADISGTVDLTGTMAFNAINANNATWSGAISGGGEIVKRGAGAGTLFLSSASNSYTGDTTVESGTLAISGAGRLGTGSYAGNIAVASGATFSYASSAAQTLNGVISGDGAVSKSGAGALTLGGAASNTYTGTTTVYQGSLTLAKTDGAKALSGDLTFDNNLSPDVYTTVDNQFAPGAVVSFVTNAGEHGRFELIGTTQTVAGIQTVGYTIARGVIQNREFGPANTGTGTLVLDGAGAYTYGAYLRDWNGTLALTKSGAGTQTLAGAQITYTGATTLSGGVLELSNASGFNSAVAVSSGATLRFSNTASIGSAAGFDVTLGNGAVLTHNGQTNGGDFWVLPGGVTTSGNTTINQDSIANTTGANKSFFIDGGLHGTGTVTINAANAGNAVVLRNTSSTFTGDIIVNGVASTTVNAGSGIAIGGANTSLNGVNFTVNGTMELLNQGIGWSAGITHASFGALNGTGVVVGNYTSGGNINLTLGNTNSNGSFSGTIANGAGNIINLVKTGSGTQTLSGVNAYTGATTISGGTLAIAGAGQLGGGSYAGAVVNNATFRYESSANQTLSGAVSGSGQLINSGTGKLTLSGATSYSGGTTVNQGTLAFNLTSRSNNGAMNLGTTQVAAGATLELFTSAAATYGTTALTTGGTIYTGSGTIVKTGPGIVDWWGTSAANTTSIKNFTGLIDIQQGTLANQTVNDWSVSAGGMSLNIASGAYFDLRTAGAVVNNLTGGGTIGSSYSAGMILTVGAQNGSSTFNGVIQNTVPSFLNAPTIGLTKTGSGTLTLTGANTYSGVTTVNGGILTIAGSHAGNGVMTVNAGGKLLINGTKSGTGAITVANNATLGGHGILAGNTTIQSGGTLSPGTSPGTITFNNSLTLQSGAEVYFEGGDLVVVNGLLTLPSTWVLDLTSNGTTWAYNPNLWTVLFDYNTASLAGGWDAWSNILFPSLPFDTSLVTLVNDTASGEIRLMGMYAVPEPSTWAMGLLAITLAGAACGLRRARK